MSLPPIYVISLARAEKRREAMTSRLNAANVQFEITDAVDGKSLDFSTITRRLNREKFRKTRGYEMMPGEVACTLSHYRLWERMVAEQTPYALILEDNATWQPGFFQIVGELVESKYDWNVIHLACQKKRKIESVLQSVGDARQLVRFKKPGAVTTAYLIDLDGAKKLIKHCYEIYEPIDLQWRFHWECDLAFYFVYPAPAKRDESQSLIGDRKKEKSKHQWQRMISRFRRLYRSFGEWQSRKAFHKTHPPKLRS